MGQGLAAPPPPPRPTLVPRRNGRTGSLDQMSTASALPWPRCGLPGRPSLVRPLPHCRCRCPRRARTRPPSQSACADVHLPGTKRGCPSWCLEHQCRTPRCPLHDLHAGALCASHRVCMGCHCPTLLVPARCAGGGRGSWGSRCRAPVAQLRLALVNPRPRHALAAPSQPPLGAMVGRVKGGRRLVPPTSRRLPLLPPLFRAVQWGWGGGAGRCPGRHQCARYRGKNIPHWARGPGLRCRRQRCHRGR